MSGKLKSLSGNKKLTNILKALICLALVVILVGMRFSDIFNSFVDMNSGWLFCFAGNALFTVLGVIAICYAVFRFEDLLREFKSAKKKGFSYALYFSVSLILSYNPIDVNNTEVSSFKRIMGAAFNENIDVTKRVNNFNLWFVSFAVIFALLYLLANHFLSRDMNESQKKIADFLDGYMVFANCSLLLNCITFFTDSAGIINTFSFSQSIVLLVAVVAVCYLVLSFDKFVPVETFEMLSVISLGLAFTANVFLGKKLGTGRMLYTLCIILSVLIFIAGRLFSKKLKKGFDTKSLSLFAIVLSAIPLLTSLYIESINILNQHSVFIAHPAKYYKILVLAGIVLAAVLIFVLAKKKFAVSDWKDIAFPLIVAGTTGLSIQIPLSAYYYPHIYEGANSSILMSGFLNYGEIPLVEHYGGHMMTAVWEGILYAVLNKDYQGVASPYKDLLLVVLAVLVYLLISKIWNKTMALFIALFMPYMDVFSFYGLGILVCLAAMAYVKKNTLPRAVAVWGAFIWCALYRLDLGFAFGLAVIVALIIYCIAEKNKKAFKELGVSLLGWGVAGMTAWFVICLAKGISPVKRLLEFVAISMSNQNWAFIEMGETGNMSFAIGYLFVPFLMVLALLYTVFSKSFREKIGKERWVLLMILGVSYFQNFSRGIVRHSLRSEATDHVFWCAFLFLALFIAFYKGSMKWFVPAFMSFTVAVPLLFTPANYTFLPIADRAVSSAEPIIDSWTHSPTGKKFVSDDGREFSTEWELIKYSQKRVQRVLLTDELMNYTTGFELVLDHLLEGDETYVDFINKSLLYSVMGYRSPVYVAQSPLLLSGEFSQTEFIKEIEGVPVVLMPADAGNLQLSTSLDGITNAYRYYKVYEYIYKNYVPLCKYSSDFAVWCLPEKYEGYKAKVSELIASKDYSLELLNAESLTVRNAALEKNNDGNLVMRYTADDPMVIDLQNVLDLSGFIGRYAYISVNYKTDVQDVMQMYYTTEKDEDFSSKKVESVYINDEGVAVFKIPVTQYTRLRLDTPWESTVVIRSMTLGNPVTFIDYGYDGPFKSADSSGNVKYEYPGSFHYSSIGDLARIWAESDKERAIDNPEIFSLSYENGYYVFDKGSIPDSENGNYLKITADFDGKDGKGYEKDNDEYVKADIYFGLMEGDELTEKYCYTIWFDEGSHNYLIRCSTDYYWYLKDVNAVWIDCDGELKNVSMSVIDGD